MAKFSIKHQPGFTAIAASANKASRKANVAAGPTLRIAKWSRTSACNEASVW